MKKLLAAALAALTTVSLGVGVFAAPTYKSISLESLSGAMVLDDGIQVTVLNRDSVEPNQTVYYMLPPSLAKMLDNSKNYRMTVKKNKGSKLVASVKLAEKRLSTSSGAILLPNKSPANVPADFDSFHRNTRNTYLAIDLNDTTSAEEQKVELTITVTFKNKTPSAVYYGNSTTNKLSDFVADDKLEMKTAFYVANKKDEGDATVTVGTRGTTIKPVRNQDNEIIFEGGDTLATLRFKASSNPDDFYAKLSTKWTSDLSSKFRNTDAVIRKFSSATIPATSRAELYLNNPFDPDEVSPSRVYVYSVGSSGKLSLLSRNSVLYDEDEDAFVIKTRSLGTWILSDVKIKLN